MKLAQQFLTGLFVAVYIGLPATSMAQADELQTLVDELQALTEKAREQRAADRWLQNAMEDLVAKYNFPWRDSLFTEDFSDGDYNSNPSWQVSSGEFWVDRRLGLRSQVKPEVITVTADQPQQQRQQQQDLGKALLGAFLQEALGPTNQSQNQPAAKPQQTETIPASIRTELQIPTTFALESVFSQNNRPGVAGKFEWIVMQDEQANNAYRVMVSSGDKGIVDVIRTHSGRDSYLDSVEVPELKDGGEHVLSWRQTAQGSIEIYLDGTSILKTTDKPFRYGFKYLGMVNRAGDFSVTGIEVLGGR